MVAVKPGILVWLLLGICVLLLARGIVWRQRRPGTHHRKGGPAAALAVLLAFAGIGTLWVVWRAPARRDREPAYQLRLEDDLEAWRKADVVAGGGAAKPWLADAAGSRPWSETSGGMIIAGRRPGPEGKLVGYSGLEPDPEAARRAAELSAARQLEAILLSQVKEYAPHRGPALPPADILPLIRERVLGGRLVELIVDRFEEPVEMPISKAVLHRTAVLVRADPETLARLGDAVREGIETGAARRMKLRRDIIWTGGAAAVMALVVFLIYSFLNAGTKGHFAWPLRVVSLGALILLYVGLLYWRGLLPPMT
jgi:hypothetical protein